MRPALSAALLIVCLAGCAPASSSPGPTPTSTPVPAPTRPPELTIYGAASLKGVLEAAKAAYESTVGGVTLVISIDSSPALETKIEQGAPADLFLSADTANPQKLVEKGLAAEDPISFAGNQLTIIVPDDNPAGIKSPADLGDDGVRIIGAGDEVPITKYAKQLVANLAAMPGYPNGFAEAYAANVLSKEENVKGIVAKIELGEGDAGIVYVTDAVSSSKVRTVKVPAGANVFATYAAVIVKASTNQPDAQSFLDWLRGPEGLAILQGLGFLPPPE